MRISTSGGVAEQVSKAFFRASDISPDGTHACGMAWDAVHRNVVSAVLDIRSGAADAVPGGPWEAFYVPGRGLAGFERLAGKPPLRVWPPQGGAPAAVTPPLDDHFFLGAASRDGRIALSLGQRISDVVLISAK